MPLMLLLGWAVGRTSTPLDDWFQRARGTGLGWLLFFTDPRTVLAVLLVPVAVAAARRQWPLVAVVLLTPYAAVWMARGFKHLFGRIKEGAIAYPSGHTTLMVVVLGMVILVFGMRLWLMATCVVFALLGMLGQAVTYHYFTDTIGAVLLGTSVVCAAAQLTGVKHTASRVTMAS